jgi:type II secretion system protein I
MNRKLQLRIADCGLRIKFRRFGIRNPKSEIRNRTTRRGFTLLEIILSLAILAGALAALGEVMRLADQNASMTGDETQAQILAASIMDELIAGSRALSAVSQAPLDTTDEVPWLYTVEIENTTYEQLVSVRVRVEQQLEARLQPAHFELVRWLPNPDYVPPQPTDDQSSSSTTGSSSSSTGSSSGGQP